MPEPPEPNSPPPAGQAPNPYQAPITGTGLPPGISASGSQFAPCPSCQQQAATKISFSWWGGILGPKLLTHVKCGHCGHKYNGRTGGSNALGIAIYWGAGFVICFVVMIALFGLF